MQTDLGDYVKLAEQCISDIETLHADYIFALEKFSDISTEHDQMRYLVENKKNQMLSTGMVTGKNAEERAANLWVAITEYDDLQELSVRVANAKVDLEVAQSSLKLAKDKMSFYSLMIEALAGLDTNG